LNWFCGLCFSIGIVAALAGNGRAENWPQWRGPENTGVMSTTVVASLTRHGYAARIPGDGRIRLTSEVRKLSAGYRDDAGKFHEPPGGTLMHLFSVPPHNCQVAVYEEANVIGKRISIPLFGAGLIEAILDETLIRLADPFDTNGDGVRGRAAMIEDVATGLKRVGRFGWKANQPTLEQQMLKAFNGDLGITSAMFPVASGNGRADGGLRGRQAHHAQGWRTPENAPSNVEQDRDDVGAAPVVPR